MYFNTDAYAKLYPRTEAKAPVKVEKACENFEDDIEDENEETVEEVEETEEIEEDLDDAETGEEEA